MNAEALVKSIAADFETSERGVGLAQDGVMRLAIAGPPP
jgi:hypothetical protein